MQTRVLVTGAGGFIGHHLVTTLKGLGYWVRGVDLRVPPYSPTTADEFELLDLRRWEDSRRAAQGMHEVYALAAQTSRSVPASCRAHDNLLINLHSLEAARQAGARRLLLASSACDDALSCPANPANPHPLPLAQAGCDRLLAEQLCASYRQDYGLETHVARLVDVYGPHNPWDGGEESPLAAVCRRAALARLSGDPTLELEPGDAPARFYCYIDDCVEGLHRLMHAQGGRPSHLGQGVLLGPADLAGLLSAAAGVEIVVPEGGSGSGDPASRPCGTRPYDLVGLLESLRHTYAWIEAQALEGLLRARRAPLGL